MQDEAEITQHSFATLADYKASGFWVEGPPKDNLEPPQDELMSRISAALRPVDPRPDPNLDEVSL